MQTRDLWLTLLIARLQLTLLPMDQYKIHASYACPKKYYLGNIFLSDCWRQHLFPKVRAMRNTQPIHSEHAVTVPIDLIVIQSNQPLVTSNIIRPNPCLHMHYFTCDSAQSYLL